MATVASGGATPFVGKAPPFRSLRGRRISSSLSSRKTGPSEKVKPPTRVQLKSEPDAPKPVRIARTDDGKVENGVLDRSEVFPRGIRDYVQLSRELIRSAGGSIRWFSPIECAQCEEESPLLLYLPG